MLVLSRAETEACLDPDALVDALRAAMADLSAGRASMPVRVAARVEEHDAFLAAMPAYLPSAQALVTKLVSVFPRNRDLPTHQAVVLAFDPATGEPLALMDGTSITAARTAAGSALATGLLARADARVLAIIGTGVQARSHARAVTRVRAFDEVRIAGRDPAKAAALAAELGATPMPSVAEAMAGADVVCATTHADEPVIAREHVSDGMHLCSVGFNPAGREVDEATVRDALVVVESREAALAPFPGGANDLLWPIRDGAITPEHIHAELGELVSGVRPARTDEGQITLYKSVGVAVQDAAAAALVLVRARERGLGTESTL